MDFHRQAGQADIDRRAGKLGMQTKWTELGVQACRIIARRQHSGHATACELYTTAMLVLVLHFEPLQHHTGALTSEGKETSIKQAAQVP